MAATEVAFETVCRAPTDVARRALHAAADTLAQRSRDGRICVRWSFEAGRQTVGAVAVPVVVETTGGEQLFVRAAQHEGAFPTFAGRMEALDDGALGTRIRLRGDYRVPLGRVGRLANGAGGHRVAEAALRHFFETLVAETEAALRREAHFRPR